MRRSRKMDNFEVGDVAGRLLPYGLTPPPCVEHDQSVEAELVDKAVTLLTFMPRNQSRESVERLLSPHDPQRGRRAVDALIEAELAAEDERGRLRRIV